MSEFAQDHEQKTRLLAEIRMLESERDRWRDRAELADGRERIATETYNGQQQSYRELETLYQASQERALNAEAEIARLRTDLELAQAALSQAERALLAERAARQNAEADAAALVLALRGRQTCKICGGRGITWTDINGEAEAEACECWIFADEALAHPRPGAAVKTGGK